MRKWRVGTISMGILLVATGLLLLLSEIQGFNGASMIMRWWPAILIVLGIEILAYIMFSHEEQPKIKFDGFSIFLVVFIVLVSSGVYGVSTFVKSDFSQAIFGEIGYFKNETIINKNYEIDSAKVKKLQINNSKGQIQVNEYDGSTIKVDVAIMVKNNDEESALNLVQDLVDVMEGETLSLNTRSASLLDDTRNYQVTINYAVKVPKEMEFDINNKYGDIILEDLKGNAKIVGKHGSVEVDNIQGDVLIENSFGETRVKNIIGKVEIDNEHGEIFFSNKQVANQDIILNCKMSGINLELPRQQEGSFEVFTKFGEITMDGFDSELSINTDETEQELKGTINKAKPVIILKAEHGSINLNGN